MYVCLSLYIYIFLFGNTWLIAWHVSYLDYMGGPYESGSHCNQCKDLPTFSTVFFCCLHYCITVIYYVLFCLINYFQVQVQVQELAVGDDGHDVVDIAPCGTRYILMEANLQPPPVRKVSKVKLHLKIIPSHCELCYCSSVYWSGQSITLFTHVSGIGPKGPWDPICISCGKKLEKQSQNIKSVLTSENTWVFAGLLKHIKHRSRYQDLVFVSIESKCLSFHVSVTSIG